MQYNGGTSGEDEIRTHDLLTASQVLIAHKYLIFKHLRIDNINVCQKCVKNECKISKSKV
jgi:hypothetical protein